MPLPVIKYPLDKTGISPNNLVVGEEHILPARAVRAIAPRYGAFYSESLVLFDVVHNRNLVKDTDYYPAEMYEIPTAEYGKEICAVIIITNPAVGNDIHVKYQALGGEFSSTTTAIASLLDALNLDNRPTSWPNIINKPAGYPPAHHLHDIGDTYGWEYIAHALERVADAIRQGDAVQHENIYKYIDLRQTIFIDTKATDLLANLGVDNNAWMTPKTTASAINALVPNATETKAGKIQLATLAETTAGVDTTKAVNPATLKSLLNTISSNLTLSNSGVAAGNYGAETDTLKISVDSRGIVTAAQSITSKPDWGNVKNKPTTLSGYGIIDSDVADSVPLGDETQVGKIRLATNAEAVAGVDNTKGVHPAGLKAAINANIALATETLAGKVELATILETTTGSDSTRAVHPAGVAAAISNALTGYSVSSASETLAGKVELATSAETVVGTDNVRATHSAGVKAAIESAIANLINSAPGALNTLDELAAALGDDPNFATTITNTLAGKAATTHTHSSLVNGSSSATLDAFGNLYVSGDITAFSDETLKTNWRTVNNLVFSLSNVKAGIFDRTDMPGTTQVGVSAQSLERVLKHAVFTNEDGIKSVAYGNAALVACVELCKEVINLQKQINELRNSGGR